MPVSEFDSPPAALPASFAEKLMYAASWALQLWTGLTTYLFVAWALDRFIRKRDTDERVSATDRLIWSIVLCVASGVANFIFVLPLVAVFIGVVALTKGLSAESFQGQNPAAQFAMMIPDYATFFAALFLMRGSTDYRGPFEFYGRVVRVRAAIWNRILGLIGTVIVLGLSLLPLSALLLAFPAIVPQESVLTDTVSNKRSWLRSTFARVFALMAGFTILLTLLAISVELLSRAPLPDRGSFAIVARFFTPAPYEYMGKNEAEREEAVSKMPPAAQKFVKTPLHEKLPKVMIEHWPFVILAMYFFDVLILMFIGKVPLAYNLRNVRVRWKTNLMTAVAFMSVIGLLVFLLAFVNGMNNLTENTGVPGNVIVLSDGATDELFSNLGPEDLNNLEQAETNLDEKDQPIPIVRVKTIVRDGKPVPLASRETYHTVNQTIPNTDPPKRRFLQVRSLDDAETAAEVHKISLYPPGRWFGASGVDANDRIECVLGEGVAKSLAEDYGKKRFVPGDTFTLGGMQWVVTGVMKSEGTTFGSEIWVKRFSLIYESFRKPRNTTLVLRAEPETPEAAKALAYHLSKRYPQTKLKAFSEPDYYSELTKTNNFFLTAIVIVAVVMAIGGVFGMMTTMFASIAQRIRDIGVLRLLGFKRWQVTVSFLLESLTVALIGGTLGCIVAWVFADGKSSVSTLSGGGGGPGGKSFALTIDVDAQVVAMGLLFTMVMGRLGGLVPALSAMRVKILDSLR